MARTFVRASSQHLSIASAVLSAHPVTLAAWVRPATSNTVDDILSITDGAGANNGWVLRQTATGTIQALSDAAGAFDTSTTAGTVTNGTWAHAAAVFASSTSRTAYLNGVAATVNATSLTPGSLSVTRIGAAFAPQNFYDGDIAEAAIWSVALDAAEIAALAKGVSPLLIRPTSLVAYWPLIGNTSPEIDPKGRNELTVTGATAAPHPRVLYPTVPQWKEAAQRVSAVLAADATLAFTTTAALRTTARFAADATLAFTATAGLRALSRFGADATLAFTATANLVRGYDVTFTVNGVDRTLFYDRHAIQILDDLNELPNTLSFECFGFTPANNQIVRVLVGSTKEFEGTITSISEYHDRLSSRTVYRVSCTDYTRDFDALFVTKAYGSQSGTTTAQDIVTNFTSGFTQVHIAAALPTVAAIQFKMTKPSSGLRQLCDAIGGDCYVDYDKDVHLFLTETDVVPLAVSAATTHWKSFSFTSMIARVVNRIFVEGKSSTALAEAAVGATSVTVVSADPYSASGGSVVQGNQVITYTGVGTRVVSIDTWATQTPSATAGWFAIAWSPALQLFAAASINTSDIMTSPDGITWTARTGVGLDHFTDMIWSVEKALFVAVSNAGGIMTSPNGTTWTSRTPAVAGKLNRGIAWSPSLSLFAIVNNSGVAASAIMTSPDGITWTSRTAPSTKDWLSVTWAAALGLFVAVANDTSTAAVMTSPDGITWTARTTPGAVGTWSSVTWSSTLGLLVAVSNAAAVGGIMTSPDGITWTSRTQPEANAWSRVIWADGLAQFISVATAGTHRIMTSSDGLAWTAETAAADGYWSGLAWASDIGTAVAVAQSSLGTIQVMTAIGTSYGTLTGIPPSGAGSIVTAISGGDEINILVQRDDAASQATYGIRQAYIQDRRLSQAGAQARGDAELTLRKDPYIEGSYITTDTNVRSGRRVTISMASEWGVSGTYTISRVRVFWDKDHKMPLREVTFSSNAGASDLFRLLRRIQEQQQQQSAA